MARPHSEKTVQMTTTDIFQRHMTWLRRVNLTKEELRCDGNIKTITIADFTDTNRQFEYQRLISEIRSFCSSLDAKKRNANEVRRLKSMLPCGIISGVFNGMGANDIKERNGVIALDIDQADNPDIHDWNAFKNVLGRLSSNFAYIGLSASGLGVWCLVPVGYPKLHEQHFDAMVEDFKNIVLQFNQGGKTTTVYGVILDTKPRNISAKRFLSLDPHPYINKMAVVYERLKEAPQRRRTTFSDLAHHFAQQHEVFNIENWLEQHGIEYEKRPKAKGTQYIVTCPWEHLHSGTGKADAAIFVHQNGAIGYNCFHSHCEGKGWQHYRAFYGSIHPSTAPTNFNNNITRSKATIGVISEPIEQESLKCVPAPSASSTITPLPSNINDGSVWALCPQHLFEYLKQKNEAFVQLCDALDLCDPEDPEEPF